MRSSKKLIVVATVALMAGAVTATDPNVKDINKVESELADAQQRLQNVKDRLAASDSQHGSESIAERLSDAVGAIKNKIPGVHGSMPDIDLDKTKASISNLGQETYTEKAGRKIRETFGRDTLIDNAQRVFNEAKADLSKSWGSTDLSSLGEESVTEKTARRVREILGQETARDKMQRKYLEARDALNEAKDLDFTAFPEKANYLKERILQLGQQAQSYGQHAKDSVQSAYNAATDKLSDMVTPEEEATIWNRIKGRLGLTREPTASEKAALIAQHMKEMAQDQAASMMNKGSSAKANVASSFNNFLSKLGRGPAAAVNMAQQWVSSTPEERNAVRSSNTISAEAHDALDDLLTKLLLEVGDENAERVESIQVSVKPKSGVEFNKESPSYLTSIKNSLFGAGDEDLASSHTFDPKLGYEGLKNQIAELMHKTKASTWGESVADKVAALAEESYADKAARKVREAMGRDTATDKLYHLREQAMSGSILDMIRQRLPSSMKLSDIDLKASLSSLGEESYAEKAARKVRESLGSDTLSDKIHAALEDIKGGNVMNAASAAASNKFDDVKDMLSSFTGETRSERIARKVREALGRDTMLDKAHAKVDEAAQYYHSLSSVASLASKANDMKNSVMGGAASVASNIASSAASSTAKGIYDSVTGASADAPKSRFTQVKEAILGDPKDNKIAAAEKLLQDAVAKLEQAKKM